MRMKILNVAYPLAPVREETAGGAEHVLQMLDKALHDTGHHSYVIACEGSQVSGELVETYHAKGRLDPETQARARRIHQAAILHAIELWEPDLIHLHGIDFMEYIPPPGVTVLVTLHLPPSWYDEKVFALKRPNTWLHCVSKQQEESCPKAPNLLPFIPNGVPSDLPRTDVSKREFAVAMGRICPEKGYHLAFDAAQIAGIPLVLAGETYAYEAHECYYHREIKPRCDQRRHFIGAVGSRQKRRLLSAARCLLVPSLAPETSCLVAMEAAMCGTPTIAFRSGALPEIIEHGVTGYLVDDMEEMAGMIRRCGEIDPAVCRQRACERFSQQRTIAGYFGTYRRLMRHDN